MASLETSYQQFLKKIESLGELDDSGKSGFHSEFLSLRQTSFAYKSDKDYPNEAGQLPINRVKNRFKDILPFDSTRVKLSSTGVEGSDYINANHVKGVNNNGVYIASQGPLPNTVTDFWRMVWEYKTKVVVMLCREHENGKKKCQRYWPKTTEDRLKFNGITVKMKKSVSIGDDFTIRTLVAECEEEELVLTQFHYTAWPDHGVPPTVTPMIELIKLVREYQPEDNSPIIYHCSAGCGRTGTICALDYTYSLLEQKRADEVDPYEIVHNLRTQRPAMVQTKGQYEFMCHVMCALFRKKLDLPIDEEMNDHLYENVSKQNYSDSDSESNLSPAVARPDPFPSTSVKNVKCPVFIPEKDSMNKGAARPVAQSTTAAAADKIRMGQVGQSAASDSYVNVNFDLIDLSDGTTSNGIGSHTNGGNGNGSSAGGTGAGSSTGNGGRTGGPNATTNGVRTGTASGTSNGIGARVGTASSTSNIGVIGINNHGKREKPAIKKQHSEDFLVSRKPQATRQHSAEVPFASISKNTPVFDDHSDYVFAASRGNQSPTRPKDKLNGANTGQKYENVVVTSGHIAPKPQNRSTAESASAVNNMDQNYMNVEFPAKQTGNMTRPPDKSAKPVIIGSTKPEVVTQRKSSSMEHISSKGEANIFAATQEKKPGTHGPKSGMKTMLAAQDWKPASCGPRVGAHIAAELPRARVLPNEVLGESGGSEALRQQKFFDDVNSGLYAPVNRRQKSSNRSHISEETFQGVDTMDSGPPPVLPKRSPEMCQDEHHDLQHELKSKGSSLTSKINFLSRKPGHESRNLLFENIGYGVRLAKPKGPRSPPRSWMVRS